MIEPKPVTWKRIVDHRQVCEWLGVPPDNWPPDHYALLGLQPGESDVTRIEQQVHERLIRLRNYQLNYPEQVTEAMNRLARAFTCLTDPETKKSYDALLLTRPRCARTPAANTTSEQSNQKKFPAGATTNGTPEQPSRLEEGHPTEAKPESQAYEHVALDPLAWLYGSWHGSGNEGAKDTGNESSPGGPGKTPGPGTPSVVSANDETLRAPDAAISDSGVSPVTSADPLTRTARSLIARRGLSTQGALCERITLTRRLLFEWESAGRYLKQPERPLKRPEIKDLARRLGAIRRLLKDFPPIVGQAGQRGYFVVALASQAITLTKFDSLDVGQRLSLALDWQGAHKLLRAHHQFLLGELKTCRAKGPVGKLARIAHAFYSYHPFLFLLVLVGVALGVVVGIAIFWHKPSQLAVQRANQGEAPRAHVETKIDESKAQPPSSKISTSKSDSSPTRKLSPPKDVPPLPLKKVESKPGPSPAPAKLTRPEIIRHLSGHSGPIRGIDIDAKGEIAVSSADDHTVRVWNLKEAAEPSYSPIRVGSEQVVVATSPDGKHGVFAGLDPPVRAWNLQSGALEARLPHAWIRSVAYAPDSSHFVAAGDDGRDPPYVYDIGPGKASRRFGLKHNHRVDVIAFLSPEQLFVASPRLFCRHNLKTQQEDVLFAGKNQEVANKHLNFAVNGSKGRVLTRDSDNCLRSWDLNTEKVHIVEKDTEMITSLAISNDGTRYLSGSDDGVIRLWELESSRLLYDFNHEPANPVTCLALSADGHWLISGAADGSLILWRLP